MPHVEAVDAEAAIFWLIFLVILDDDPIFKVGARDQPIQEIFLQLKGSRINLLLFFEEVTGN